MTEVKEAMPPEDKLATANAEIDALKKKCADLEAKAAAADTVKAEAEVAKTSCAAKEAEAVALVTELRALKNTWSPEGRSNGGVTTKVGEVDVTKAQEMIKNKK